MEQNHIARSLLEEQEITAAKTSLEMSVQRFEMAMDGLANRVDVTAQSIQHAKDIATAPQRFFINAKGTMEDFSSRAVVAVRKNPKPFVAAAVGVVGFGILLYFTLRKPAPVYRPVVKELDKQFDTMMDLPFVKTLTKRVLNYF